MLTEMIVDKIAGNTVVLLTGGRVRDSIVCPINILPREIKEGDVIKVSFEVDPAATEQACLEAAALLQELLAK